MKMQGKASQLLNAYLVALAASIPTIEQHERPDYLKELDLLRQQGQLLFFPENKPVVTAPAQKFHEGALTAVHGHTGTSPVQSFSAQRRRQATDTA